MCCLIVSKDGKMITEKEFFTAVDNNPDGIGIAHSDGTTFGNKKFLSEDLAWEYFTDHMPTGHRYVIHFRNASAGTVSLDNVHPFPVGDDTFMFHNGTLYAPELCHDSHSDTKMLAIMLKKYKQPIIGNHILINLLSGYADPSKLVFFKKTGAYQIINFHLGIWEEARNIWFSNNGYREKNFYGKPKFQNGKGWNGGWAI